MSDVTPAGESWRQVPCKLWTGGTNNNGHGVRYVRGSSPQRYVILHREALEQKIGRPIKPGLYALHYCEVPRCYEPEHLHEGKRVGSAVGGWKGERATYSAMHHRVYRARGRASRCVIPGCTSDGPFHWANISGDYNDIWDYMQLCRTHHDEYDRPWEKRRGEDHCTAKLTEEAVREIRRRSSDGESVRSLARAFPIGTTQVSRIVRGQSWQWLK